jgi:hypothetical protein
MAITIGTIALLQPGDTPWLMQGQPRLVPGPWGSDEQTAIATYERRARVHITQHWLRGNVLFVITEPAPTSG